LVNVVDTLGDEVILGDEVTVGEIFGEKTGEKVMLKLPGGWMGWTGKVFEGGEAVFATSE